MQVIDGLSVAQTARRLGLAEATIRLYVRTGRLAAFATALGYLIPEAEVERLARERRANPPRRRER